MTAPSTNVSRGPGRPPRTPEARAAQRRRLLEAAMAAVRRIGPDVSVDDLAAEAGVSKPVLYAEFGDKHGIAEAIAVALVERAEADLVAAVASSGHIELEHGLRVVLESFFDIVTGEREIYAFVFRSIRTNDRGLLDNALVRTLLNRLEHVATLLAPGVDPDLLRVVAHGTFGFMIGAVESWLDTKRPDREALVDSLVAILTSGLRAITPPGTTGTP